MGATLFDACLKAHQAGHVAGKFGLFETNPNSFLERFLTKDEYWIHHVEAETKTAIDAVETSFFSSSKEGQGGVVCRKGDGLRLLGCKGIFTESLWYYFSKSQKTYQHQ